MHSKTPLLLALALTLVASGCAGADSERAVTGAARDRTPVAAAEKIAGPIGERARAAAAAFDADPDDLAACNELGMSWLGYAMPVPNAGKSSQPTAKQQKQRIAFAITVLRECVKIDKKDLAAKQALATALINSGEFKEAKILLKTVAEAHPKDANAWHTYGTAAQQAGDKEEAADAWEEFLKVADKDDTRIPLIRSAIYTLRHGAPEPELTTPVKEVPLDAKVAIPRELPGRQATP